MRVIWSEGPLDIRAIYDLIAEGRSIGYTTVMTTVHRLMEKGMLVRSGSRMPGYVYTATCTEEVFVEQAVRQVLDGLLEDYQDLVVTHVAQRAALV
jgi:predicted transcriptional regulator